MKPNFNNSIFAATSYDSSSLGVLSTIVHQISEPGEHTGTVYYKDRFIGRFTLVCDEKSTAMQADIDLASFAAHTEKCGDQTKRFTVKPGGYLQFFVSQGPAGYHAVLLSQNEQERHAYDTRRLVKGDYFASALIRPGAYAVEAKGGKAKSEVRVAYPERGKEKMQMPAALTISAKAKAESALQVGQGVVYQVEDDDHAVSIKLAKPDDGPTPPRSNKPDAPSTPRGRFINPKLMLEGRVKPKK
ncbi:MAG: hypothetical protein IPP40_17075 [bacterium]|nr:hypothetical protein [bacterium]